MSKKDAPRKPYLRAVIRVGETLLINSVNSTGGEQDLARAIRRAVNIALDPQNPDTQRPIPGEEPLLPKITVNRGGLRYEMDVR